MTPETRFSDISDNSVNRTLLGDYGSDNQSMARPKPVGFVVKQLKPFQGKEWCVISYADGKRKLKWFATKTEAKEYATVHNQDRDDYGSKNILTAEQRFTLIKAEEIASVTPEQRSSKGCGLMTPISNNSP